jgi:HD-like signal output (HDOD) protein
MEAPDQPVTARGPSVLLGLMTSDERSHAPDLAPFPAAVLEALELCESPEAQPRDVVMRVQHEPMIAARMLRLVNSSAFGLCRQVQDLEEASNYLGLDALAETALAAAYAMQHKDRGYLHANDADFLWRRAVSHGLAARLVAEHTSDIVPSRAFLAGLLESIGLLWAFQNVPPRFLERVQVLLERGCSPRAAQSLVLRCDHLQRGALLLKSWELPAYVWQTLEDLRDSLDKARHPDLHRILRRGSGIASELLLTRERLWTLNPAWAWTHGQPGRDLAANDVLLPELQVRYEELGQL